MRVPFLYPFEWITPGGASTTAAGVNLLFWALVAVCGSVALGIACFVIYSMVRYRRRGKDELPRQVHGSLRLELTWTILPLFIFLGIFSWGATLYVDMRRPPSDATEAYVVAKQWMWKTQYADGRREINALHVPVGQPVKLRMISQDVIHSFFVPAFRVKQDVLPNRYTTLWFKATKPGKYHLFCAEYCGLKHSGMVGWVYALNPQDYQHWLSEGAAEGSLANIGGKLYHQFQCGNCHHFNGGGPGPNLRGLFGRAVPLSNGATIVADEAYLRESILNPRAKIVYGFSDIMPTFDGQLTEEQVIALMAYIKAISPEPGTEQPTSSGSTPQAYGTTPGIGEPGATANSQTKPGVR